jgi:pyruvate/2-oxoglutarate dehydrogenase complex dihydrolipoamide dehydrogenase (E3) component
MSTTQNTPSGQNDKVEEYDLVILGGGTGGTVAAWTFASKGQRVAVIERKYVGGSCPNIACLPSKNVIHSAKVASYFRRSEEFGIPKRNFAVDMRAVRERKRRMVSHWNNVYLDNYKKSGAEFILGSGRFVSRKTIETIFPDGRTRRLSGRNVIINRGTRAARESVPGLNEAQPLTHIEALELDQLPEHLLVIGGGYVGLELAQTARRKQSDCARSQRSTHASGRRRRLGSYATALSGRRYQHRSER